MHKSEKDNTWLSNIILLIVVTTLCLILGELFLRTFFKEDIVLFPRYHTDAQYGKFAIRRLRPNTTFTHTSEDGSWEFRTNSKGFRNNSNIEYKKSPDTIRVLSLGDSHTQGFEVRQNHTFSAVIERYLNGHGKKAEVINAGVSGFSTSEALVLLENEGIKYKPDFVVLGFYANDFSDNIKSGIFLIEDGKLVIKKHEHLPGIKILNILNEFTLTRWASENSYLYSFVLNGVWTFAKTLLLSRTQSKLQTEYAIPTEEVDEYKSKLVSGLLERMYNFCSNNNIQLIVLDIPRTSKDGVINSSVPDEMVKILRSNSDKFIYSTETLDEYRNIADLHVLHGHRHISELTHLLYGLEAAKYILSEIDLPEKSK